MPTHTSTPTRTPTITSTPTKVLPPCTVTSIQDTAGPLDPYPTDFPPPASAVASQFPPGSTTPQLYVNGQLLTGPGAPPSTLYEIAPQFRPQDDWIVYAGEMANHPPLNLSGANAEYAQNNGYWGDL